MACMQHRIPNEKHAVDYELDIIMYSSCKYNCIDVMMATARDDKASCFLEASSSIHRCWVLYLTGKCDRVSLLQHHHRLLTFLPGIILPESRALGRLLARMEFGSVRWCEFSTSLTPDSLTVHMQGVTKETYHWVKDYHHNWILPLLMHSDYNCWGHYIKELEWFCCFQSRFWEW